MTRACKIWLLTALGLLILGAAICLGALAAGGFDFRRLFGASVSDLTVNVHEVRDPFDRISIQGESDEIVFLPSEDGTCRVTCREKETLRHTVSVENGTLTVRTLDERKWYDYIGILSDEPQIAVSLPAGAYAALSVETQTGDVEIPADFTFDRLTVRGSTSDVTCRASVRETLDLSVSTGDLTLSDLSAGALRLSVSTGRVQAAAIACAGGIDVSSSTGKILLTGVTCQDLSIAGRTGGAVLDGVVASGTLTAVLRTGDILLRNCDAAALSLRTSTGDVTGTLLTGKLFVTDCGTGHVSVPSTSSGGRCEIVTGTGDIEISLS